MACDQAVFIAAAQTFIFAHDAAARPLAAASSASVVVHSASYVVAFVAGGGTRRIVGNAVFSESRINRFSQSVLSVSMTIFFGRIGGLDGIQVIVRDDDRARLDEPPQILIRHDVLKELPNRAE